MKFPVAGLMALNFGCLLLFQWARMRYFRRPGNDRVRGGLGPAGTVFGILQIPLVYFGATRVDAIFLVAPAILYLASAGLFGWAARSHGASRPAIAASREFPPRLVTSGAYAIARHPFYLAYLLFWAGTAAVAAWGSGIPMFFIMLFLYVRSTTREEEMIMQSPHATAYGVYRRSVGRFFRWPHA